MAQIQAYAYSEGPAGSAGVAAGATARVQATNTISVIEAASPATTTYARTAAPATFAATLATWASNLTQAAPWGAPTGTYTFTYSATTGRVTLACSVAFRPVFVGNSAAWLGFTGSPGFYSFSHVGTLTPAGVCELLAVECEPPEDAAQADVDTFRHGRAQVRLFGNHQAVRLLMYVRSGKAPADLSYLTTGRVRVFPHADTTPYQPSNLDGYFDGYVVDQPTLELRDQDESLRSIALVLAVER